MQQFSAGAQILHSICVVGKAAVLKWAAIQLQTDSKLQKQV